MGRALHSMSAVLPAEERFALRVWQRFQCFCWLRPLEHCIILSALLCLEVSNHTKSVELSLSLSFTLTLCVCVGKCWSNCKVFLPSEWKHMVHFFPKCFQVVITHNSFIHPPVHPFSPTYWRTQWQRAVLRVTNNASGPAGRCNPVQATLLGISLRWMCPEWLWVEADQRQTNSIGFCWCRGAASLLRVPSRCLNSSPCLYSSALMSSRGTSCNASILNIVKSVTTKSSWHG